jgi:hypothetical protein
VLSRMCTSTASHKRRSGREDGAEVVIGMLGCSTERSLARRGQPIFDITIGVFIGGRLFRRGNVG